ncbi:hypothetical protein KKB99_08255, partial [bacterium]|nr:hypothetical protein [bacterium]MBU1025983.1 hypothetical protein [bacterium]
MSASIKNTGLTILAVVVVVLQIQAVSHADDKVSMVPEINIQSECDQSEAELIIRISIAKGTSIDTQAELVGRLLSFYKGFWKGTDPIIDRIRKSQKNKQEYDLGNSADAVLGVDAIMSLSGAYMDVMERGLIFFPDDVVVISRERFPLIFDCLINNGKQDNNPEEPKVRVAQYSDVNRCQLERRQIDRNLNNLAVALVSFRSEFSRFPVDLRELRQSGHLLISVKNPFTNTALNFTGETGPGTINYSRPSEGRFILTVYDECSMPIRREFYAGPDNSVKGVLSLNKPVTVDSQQFTKLEDVVRIYTFQV